MAISRVPASMPGALPRASAVVPRLAGFTLTHPAGSLGFFGFLAELVDGRQVAFAHAVDKALERHIRDAHKAKVAVFAVQQTPRHRLIQVLEPVHADDRR